MELLSVSNTTGRKHLAGAIKIADCLFSVSLQCRKCYENARLPKCAENKGHPTVHFGEYLFGRRLKSQKFGLDFKVKSTVFFGKVPAQDFVRLVKYTFRFRIGKYISLLNISKRGSARISCTRRATNNSQSYSGSKISFPKKFCNLKGGVLISFVKNEEIRPSITCQIILE